MEAKQHTSKKPTNHSRNQNEIKICIEKNENNNPKPMGFSKGSDKGKIPSNTILPQEKKEKRQPNFTLKATGKSRNEEAQG